MTKAAHPVLGSIRHSSFVLRHWPATLSLPCSARLEESQLPRYLPILLAGAPFVAHALVEQDKVLGIDFKSLVPAGAEEFAVRKGFGPGLAFEADVQRAGEGLLARRRERLPLAVETIRDVGLEVAPALFADGLDEGEVLVAAFEAVSVARFEDVVAEDDFGPVPAEGELGELRLRAPELAVVRSEEEVRAGVIANDPEIDPALDVVRVRRVEEHGGGPRLRVGDVGRG